jgi:hypothetical protein
VVIAQLIYYPRTCLERLKTTKGTCRVAGVSVEIQSKFFSNASLITQPVNETTVIYTKNMPNPEQLVSGLRFEHGIYQ